MAQPSKYVMRQEFGPVKAELEKVSIRVAVLNQDVHSLTNNVADLAEEMNERFDSLTEEMNGRFAQVHDEMNRRFGQMHDEMNRRFGQMHDEMNRRFGQMHDEMDRRFELVNTEFTELKKLIADGNAALISVVMQLGKR